MPATREFFWRLSGTGLASTAVFILASIFIMNATPPDFDAEALARASLQANGLHVNDEDFAEVVKNLNLLRQHYGNFAHFTFGIHEEIALLYRADA